MGLEARLEDPLTIWGVVPSYAQKLDLKIFWLSYETFIFSTITMYGININI